MITASRNFAVSTVLASAIVSAAILSAMTATHAGERESHGDPLHGQIVYPGQGGTVAADVPDNMADTLTADIRPTTAHRHPNPYLQHRPRPDRDYFPSRPESSGVMGFMEAILDDLPRRASS